MRREPFIFFALGVASAAVLGSLLASRSETTTSSPLYLQVYDVPVAALYDTADQVSVEAPARSATKINMDIALERERKRVQPISIVEEAKRCGVPNFIIDVGSDAQKIAIPLRDLSSEQMACLFGVFNEHSIAHRVSRSEFN